LAYAQETGIKKKNATLMVSMAKNANCNAFSLELIDKSNQKVVKQTEHCFANSQNEVLQNAVHEILGHPAKKAESFSSSGNAKTILMGAGFAITGILLYYSKPPKPVYGVWKPTTIEEQK
jgi:hypothetical protein